MTRNRKLLVLSLVAALALTAASSALAFTKIGSETGTSAFKAPRLGLPSSCSTKGRPKAGKRGIEYSGCRWLGFIKRASEHPWVSVRFHALTGTLDVVPNEGTCALSGITFSAFGCTVHIFPVSANQALAGVTYSNTGTGTGQSIKIQPNPVDDIQYTAEGCPSGNGVTSNGVYGDANVAGGSSVLVGGTTNTTNAMTAKGVFMA